MLDCLKDLFCVFGWFKVRVYKGFLGVFKGLFKGSLGIFLGEFGNLDNV